MSKETGIVVEGTVLEILGGGRYRVSLSDMDMEVTAKLAGKMKMFKIKIITGDKVQIELNEYDPTQGRIIYRFGNKVVKVENV